MFNLVDIKTNEVLGSYTTRGAAYRALNRGLNSRFAGRAVFVVSA